MTTFTPYFDNDIGCEIQTVEQHNFLTNIRSMDVMQAGALRQEINDEAAVKPEVLRTNTVKIATRALTRRFQEFKRMGIERPPVQVGPPLTFGSMCVAALQGLILGDIASDLIIGHQNGVAEEKQFRKDVLKKFNG